MKLKRAWILVFAWAMACGVAYGQSNTLTKNIEDELGIVLPPSKPSVTAEQQAEFSKNRKFEKFFMLRNETDKLFKEREACLKKTDPKEIRHLRPKVESLEKRIPKMRKRFYQEANHLRQPMEKEYTRLKASYDDFNDKAAKMAKAGNDAKAARFAQEAMKYAPRVEALEQSINVLNSFLFFDEYTPIMDTSMQKVQKMSDEGIDMKKLRKMKTPKEKQEKK